MEPHDGAESKGPMNRNRITYNERNTHLRQNANHAAAAVGPDCPAGLECCREIGGWNLRDLRDSARSGSGWREVPELELELCWPVRDLTTLPFKKKKKETKVQGRLCCSSRGATTREGDGEKGAR